MVATLLILAIFVLHGLLLLNWYFFFHRNNKVNVFVKRIINQSRMIDGTFYPHKLLPSYLTMVFTFWKPLTSHLPKGYDMESPENILSETEGKIKLNESLKRYPV